jgi:hypothetical protein
MPGAPHPSAPCFLVERKAQHGKRCRGRARALAKVGLGGTGARHAFDPQVIAPGRADNGPGGDTQALRVFPGAGSGFLRYGWNHRGLRERGHGGEM